MTTAVAQAAVVADWVLTHLAPTTGARSAPECHGTPARGRSDRCSEGVLPTRSRVRERSLRAVR